MLYIYIYIHTTQKDTVIFFTRQALSIEVLCMDT